MAHRSMSLAGLPAIFTTFITALCWTQAAHAQNVPAYPAKPVNLYVGFSAGSTSDSTARTLAQRLTESLGQQFIIVNRDGAAGVIAAGQVAKAKPDGHTLLWVGISAMASTPAYGHVPYDPIKDFAPISVYLYAPYVMTVHPSVPAHNLKELIALAKARPGILKFGSSGVGGALHVCTELMLNMSATKMVHVPYRGTPAMMLDVISGQIDLVTTSPQLAVPMTQAGRLRAIAVTSTKRSTQLPEVPTMSEAGLPGYDVTGWYGMVAPAGTPKEIIALLHKHFVQALDHPSVKASIAQEGALPGGNTPEQFAAFIRAELQKYTKLVKSSQLTPGA